MARSPVDELLDVARQVQRDFCDAIEAHRAAAVELREEAHSRIVREERKP